MTSESDSNMTHTPAEVATADRIWKALGKKGPAAPWFCDSLSDFRMRESSKYTSRIRQVYDDPHRNEVKNPIDLKKSEAQAFLADLPRRILQPTRTAFETDAVWKEIFLASARATGAPDSIKAKAKQIEKGEFE